jgi:hypothetical protein
MQRTLILLPLLAATACAPGGDDNGRAGGKADDLYEGTVYDLNCVGNTLSGKRYEVNVTYALTEDQIEPTEAPYSIEVNDTTVLIETFVTKDGELVEAETDVQQLDSLRIDVTDDGRAYSFFNQDADVSPTPDFVTIVPAQGDVANLNNDELRFQLGFVGEERLAVTGTFRHAECEFAGPFADI